MRKNTKSRPLPKWQTDEDLEQFRNFLLITGERLNSIRKEKRQGMPRQPKGSGQAGLYTLEWFDTEPHRTDIKFLQSILAGTNNWTALSVWRICKKLKVQPSELFECIEIEFDE